MSFDIGRLKAGGRFTATVLAPVVLSVVGAAALVLAFVFWSAQGADERSLTRQTNLAQHVIRTELERLPHDQESVTIWDDAIYRTKLLFDLAYVASLEHFSTFIKTELAIIVRTPLIMLQGLGRRGLAR